MTATVSMGQCANSLPDSQMAIGMSKALQALQTDVAALRASLLATQTKLDADTGVADTNYHTLAGTAAPTLVSAQ